MTSSALVSMNGIAVLPASDSSTASRHLFDRSSHEWAYQFQCCDDVSGVPLPISPMTSEGMDCPRSCYYLSTVRYTARNQVFLTSFDKNASAINQQRVATLHHQHVLIEFMDVFSGGCGLIARPKRHLASVGSVEDVSFDTRSRLIRPNDPVRGVPHELREAVHAGACYSNE